MTEGKTGQSVVIESLAGGLKRYPWQVKYVLFPSPRQAKAALRAVSRRGTAWANVYPSTVRGLAASIAAPSLVKNGLSSLSRLEFENIVEEAWAGVEMAQAGDGSILGPRTHGAVESLARTIMEMRLDGLPREGLKDSPQLQKVYAGYLKLISESKSADYASMISAAAGADAGEGMVLIMAGGVLEGLSRLETAFIDSLKKRGCIVEELEEDWICQAAGERRKGAASLAYAGSPGIDGADAAAGPSVEVFSGAGPVCEVREIWRRVLLGNGEKDSPMPLDNVEIGLINEGKYLSLIYETLLSLGKDPFAFATFEHGIPADFTRPARALIKYLDWINGGFTAMDLHSLLASGDVPVENVPGVGDNPPYAYRIARALRSTGGFAGKADGLGRIGEEIERIGERIAKNKPEAEDESKKADLEDRLRAAAALKIVVMHLVEGLPDNPGNIGAADLSAACGRILNLYKPSSELEAAALDALGKVAVSLGELTAAEKGLMLAGRFRAAFSGVRIKQAMPEPGKVRVTDIDSAGLDARPLTFIPGMDDSVYPGSRVQDPFLPDIVRNRLGMKTSMTGPGKREMTARKALARLRGTVVFSWPSRDPGADRECFPSRIILDAWRISGAGSDGKPAPAAYSDLVANVRTVSYEPRGIALATQDAMVAEGLGISDYEKRKAFVLGFDGMEPDGQKSRISNGLVAMEARNDAEKITGYDGDIGGWRDPRDEAEKDSGFVLSPSRIQSLVKCPFKFFMEEILEIEPPDSLEWDPSAWLDHLQHGSLMHEIFYELGKVEMIDKKSDIGDAMRIADAVIDEYRKKYPPPGDVAVSIERDKVHEGLELFLDAQKTLGRPVLLEYGFGLGGNRREGSPSPVEIDTGNGSFLLRGRIDRVEIVETDNGPSVRVWDYKTGGPPDKKNKIDYGNFKEGEFLQPYLYAKALEYLAGKGLLKNQAGGELKIKEGGFLFIKSPDKKVRLPVDLGEKGRDNAAGLLDRACEVMKRGQFVTFCENEQSYCDYRCVCQGMSKYKLCLVNDGDVKKKKAERQIDVFFSRSKAGDK